jgi:phage terminase large subunit-like protein
MITSEIEALLAELERRSLNTPIIDYFYPTEDIVLTPGEFPATHKLLEGAETIHKRSDYPMHLEFWAKGKEYHQRLFRAGNRVGKTVAGCIEVVYHTTGLYPEWWEGKRFDTCNDWWVVGVSQESVVDVLQPLLLGAVGAFGTGLLPKDSIDFETLKDAKKEKTPVGTIRVKHKNGTYSSISFKSYEQRRETFQGTAKSILLDEEPPQDIYAECLMRTMTGNNILMMTFTPLQGISKVIEGWFPSGDFTETGDMGAGRWVTGAGMDDVKHLDEDRITAILSSYPPYQRAARRYGFPTLEEGAIFPVEEASFVVDPFEIPKHWPKAYGFDVGRNTGAAWIALDRDSGVLYTYSDFFQVEGLPSSHAQAIQARGKWLRGAIDTASRGRSATDGENLFQMYHDLGLHIQNADKAVEAGLYEMLELLTSGRLKVFNTCVSLLKEFRGYRRDKHGKVVKANDHILDAWRYAVFTRDRILRTEAEYEASVKPQEPIAIDFTTKDSWMLS